MLQHIHPNRKKSKLGSLSPEEKRIVKGLLKQGYIMQDITYIVNLGRPITINSGRITEVSNDKTITPATEEEITQFLKVQSSYDPKTLLNPYKDFRLVRAREAMMSAVEIFNNPNLLFKIEIFCVLSNIAWTYLVQEKIEREQPGATIRHDKRSKSLNELLLSADNPIKNKAVCENINKIIKIRDKVEHTLFFAENEKFGALFQSNCLNFDHYLTEWFGKELTLSNTLSLSLQFVGLQKEQVIDMSVSFWPKEIKAIYDEIESSEFANNNAFKISVHYGTEATSKTQSDITKLIDYSENSDAPQTVIKKVKIDKIEDYPLSYTDLSKRLKEINSSITTKVLNEILGKHNIRKNEQYAYINFRNKKQQEKYKKDKNIPKGTPILYKEATIEYIISLYK